jgi:hypothetical protein
VVLYQLRDGEDEAVILTVIDLEKLSGLINATSKRGEGVSGGSAIDTSASTCLGRELISKIIED